MNSTNSKLLLSLGLLVVGALVALLWPDGQGAQEAPLHLEASPAAAKPADAPDALVEVSDLTSPGLAAELTAHLDVIVVGEDGRRLEKVQLQLTNPDGELFESMGGAALRECVVGTWELVARCKGLLNYKSTIEVEPDKVNRHVVSMGRVMRIEGTVLNTFNRPFGSVPIWFLRPGEQHPTRRQGAGKLAGTMVTNAGQFEVDLRFADHYTVSLGGVESPIATSPEPVFLKPGTLNYLEVVLAGGTRLVVQVDDRPNASDAGGPALKASVLVREAWLNGGRKIRKTPPRINRKPVPPGKKRSNQGKRKAEAAEEENSEATTEGAGSVVRNTEFKIEPDSQHRAQEDRWVAYRSMAVDADGSCSFDMLPPDVELRLALIRPRDRFESTDTITLVGDQKVLVRTSLPPKRPPGIIKQSPTAELSIFTQVLGKTGEEKQPGFYWR